MKLFEIDIETRNAQAIIEAWAERNDGDVTECPELAHLIDLTQERDAKLLGLGCLVKELEAEAEAIKTESAKLMERSRTVANHAERVKNFIGGNLKAGEKLSDARVAFSWRKSEGVVLDGEVKPESLPVEFQRTRPPEIDKTAIKEALKSGAVLLFAHLEARQNLQIK